MWKYFPGNKYLERRRKQSSRILKNKLPQFCSTKSLSSEPDENKLFLHCYKSLLIYKPSSILAWKFHSQATIQQNQVYLLSKHSSYFLLNQASTNQVKIVQILQNKFKQKQESDYEEHSFVKKTSNKPRKTPGCHHSHWMVITDFDKVNLELN